MFILKHKYNYAYISTSVIGVLRSGKQLIWIHLVYAIFNSATDKYKFGSRYR